MMISAASGFINQAEKYSRDNAGKSLKKYTLLKKGELAYNHGASKTRQFGCCFELKEDEARIPYVYHSFSIERDEFSPYIALLLNNPIIDKQLKRLVTSSVRMDGLLNISYDAYMSITLSIPKLRSEQEKIFLFIDKIDKRIEKQRHLVNLLKSYKRGLENSFFNTIYQNKITIQEILTESNIKTKSDNEYPVLSSTKKGLFLQDDYFNKQASSENTTGYKILKRNQLVLSPQNLWMGNINFNNSFETGIVSPSYKIYDINPYLNKYYIACLLKSAMAIKEYTLASEQGASIVRRNLNLDLFNKISFSIPPKEEQDRIATLLEIFSKNIELEESRLFKIYNLKDTLLQKMFI